MRKILAFLVLLMLPWAARGQALADWYYWFDSDKAPRESGKLSGQNTQLKVDVSQLEVGAHMLYIQVVDTAGVSSTPVANFFYRMPDNSSISKMYYTINGESTTHDLDLGDGTFMLDVSKCRSGLNTINIHVTDNNGLASIPLTYLFCKVPPSTKQTKFYYWLDSSTTANELSFGEGQFVVDVSELPQGFHVINYCALDDEGLMSDIKTSGFYRMPVESKEKLHYWLDGDTVATEVPNYRDGFVIDVTRATEGLNTIYFQMEDNGPADIKAYHFVKVPQTENGGDMTLVCIIDGKIVGEEKVSAHGGIVKCDMDVSNMEVGLHKAMFQLITPSGSGSSIAETYFVRTLTTADIASMQCSYTIDGFLSGVQKGTCTNGAFHFDLPVDQVEDGLHRLDYRLVADNGTSTIQNSEWFYKTPLGGNKIIQYDYWLNSKSDEVQTVQLSEPKDPFQLIKLLPVSKEPIRTDCFHFEVNDGSPMMYAKNDIHFRFHDKSGRYVDADKQYVDYNVSRNVDIVKALTEVYGRETFEIPDSGTVRWYTMECAQGDSIAVNASQATSIQIFAPSGKEVYNVSGPESVKLGGMHAREDGTYYFAIHDVTGSKPEMTLNYQHIDKYAILDYDVHTVGNGGCSTITFNGNGFNDLYAVDLVSVNGSTINHIDIGHEHDANTTVTFDFTGSALGQYDAIFHFTQEDRTVKSALKVETAKDIELSTKVTYPSTFLRGTSVTYTVEITNKGNMTAYFVPAEIRLTTQEFNSISSVLFKDNTGQRIDDLCIDGMDTDSIESSLMMEYIADINRITGLSSFLIVHDSISGNDVGFTDRYYTIPPKSTVVYQIEIMSNNEVSLFARVPYKWFAVKLTSETNARRAKSENGICCEKEKWECISANVSNILGFIPGAVGCVASLADLGVYSTFEIMCANGSSPLERMKNALSNKTANFIDKGLSFILSCAGAGILKKIKKLKDELKELRLSRKIKLEQAVNYNRIYENGMSNYDNKMRLAEKYYKEGNIAEAERIEEEAKSIKRDAQRFKEESDRCYEEADRLTDEMNNCDRQIDQENLNLASLLDNIKNGLKLLQDAISCSKERLDADKKCNDGDDKGGSSSPRNSCEPNDIRGYTSESGSTHMRDDVDEVTYIIDSENDPVFADAPAHTVIITDTINGRYYDLESLSTRNITIGDVSMDLDGTEQNFIKTMDLRPRLNVVAQVEQKYDPTTGIAKWIWTSLDPMTMEPTDDVMQGVLPVNDETRNGEGHITYRLKQKTGLPDGTKVTNQADIIFDSNEPVFTPVWTNTIDAVPPTSHVSQLEIVGNDSVCVHFEGADERSGVWKYELYVQHGEGSGWWKEAETDSTCCGFRFYNNIKYSFCVLATDSAGNVERKEFAPEKILYVGRKGDVNTDGEVNVTDIVYTADHILGNVDEAFNASAADMNDDKEINVTDIVYIADEILNGDVDQRSAVKSNRARTVTNSADALTIEPFNIDSGETKVVTLEMNNPGYDITAFQCDVTLPNGLHIAKSGNGKQGVSFNKDTKRADASTHSLTAMSREAGVNRFVCYSITNEPFFGYTGGVIDIPVTADATMADGEYTVLIDNITMTCKDKTQLKPAPVMVKISVNNATSVHSLNADDPSAEYYDVGGRKRDTIIKGVNIVRKNDNVNKVIK